jgi:TRAP-type transport system small permease protein
MSTVVPEPALPAAPLSRRVAQGAMAACLAVMASCVFVNVVLRYGFGSSVQASEELSRLLFVWMVFIGATAAYPAGEHMAFTSFLEPLQKRPAVLRVVTRLIHALVALGAGMVAWGAWAQVVVGMGDKSPVMGYPTALLPLPAFLCCAAICVMALINLLRGKRIALGHGTDVE